MGNGQTENLAGFIISDTLQIIIFSRYFPRQFLYFYNILIDASPAPIEESKLTRASKG